MNTLDVISRLEPVEYNQTYALVDQYNEDTPQSHQCGCIAQQVQHIGALKHVVLGGEVGEDGKDTVRCLSYNAVFTYAVKAIQELHQIGGATTSTDRRAEAADRSVDLKKYYMLDFIYCKKRELLKKHKYIINLLAVS